METTIDNRIAEVTTNIHGERGVRFTVIGNAVINEFHLQSFFDCSDEDSDEELLSAATEWYTETWLNND
jgi:predicted nucleotidyltransferase